jgi:hypothetical protein
MFADDTADLASGDNLSDLIFFVNNEIKKRTWFCANKMAVNVSKTKFILFHTSSKNIDPNLKDFFDDSNQVNTMLI